MWLAVIAVIIGLAILVWSADIFIDGATVLAKRLKVPSFLIGMLIIGIGTSAPELVVSVLAALEGSPDLALGNAYGSNIVNIALVLGATLLISPLIIRKGVVKRDLPILVLITTLAAWQLRDGRLSQADGIVLLLVLVVVIGLQIVLSVRAGNSEITREHKDDVIIESESLEHVEPSLIRGLVSLFIGLLILVLSSRAIVWGAIELATLWGVSELIIGLTVVAIGTSLPELVSSLSAARKGEHDMALGNVIGSNLFNTLGVVGVAAIIVPITANPVILSRDVLVMAVLTLLLFILCLFAFTTKRKLGRLAGTVLVLSFLGYTLWLIQTVSI
ncbi:calcium/sodium antiporter [Psychrobacter sp. 72-O-c]|uniref:calcium/sodium antiporter n=1 Tax=Psychrobacter sp. 72-O-c TaxID=2774125 RepID=UPI00191B48BF|nr:calcium/sodium antiporter [Psychrobacter sp. 72-O-c]